VGRSEVLRRLTGRTALITGGGTGIGREIALRFAAEGARVVVTGRRPAPLHGVVDEIRAAGGEASAEVAAVDDDGARAALLAAAVDGDGRLHVLVNNAATYEPATVDETSLAAWERTLAVNLTAPFALARAARPALTAAAGTVINISSTIALRPVPGAASYCVSKAGLDMLTRVLAIEWAEDGIRANSILLGIVDTPIHDARALPDRAAWERDMGALHPLGRMGQPADAAAAAVFLASDEAAWVTGASMVVDGGISLV